MIKVALVYGSAAGAVTIGFMIICLALTDQGSAFSHWLGFAVMLAGLSLVYFGIRQYRQRNAGGVISFVSAFGAGLAIALVAALVYAALWEVYLAATSYQFIDSYTAAAIETARANGADAAKLEKTVAQMEMMRQHYPNPLYRLPLTFFELFPFAALVALISAFVLRNARRLFNRNP